MLTELNLVEVVIINLFRQVFECIGTHIAAILSGKMMWIPSDTGIISLTIIKVYQTYIKEWSTTPKIRSAWPRHIKKKKKKKKKSCFSYKY